MIILDAHWSLYSCIINITKLQSGPLRPDTLICPLSKNCPLIFLYGMVQGALLDFFSLVVFLAGNCQSWPRAQETKWLGRKHYIFSQLISRFIFGKYYMGLFSSAIESSMQRPYRYCMISQYIVVAFLNTISYHRNHKFSMVSQKAMLVVTTSSCNMFSYVQYTIIDTFIFTFIFS